MNTFEWVSPGTVAEAISALKSAPAASDLDDAARPIAGGQDLLTTMKDYITRPVRVVNLKGIRGLDKIEADGKGGLRIGALVTLAQLEEHAIVRRNFPGLSEAAHSVGTPQIRNLGTVGGNLCQRPASKFAAHSTYLKFKERDSMDFAMSAVAAAVAIGPNKTIREARLVLGGVAPVPWRVTKAEGYLAGKTPSVDVLTHTAKIALEGAEPLAKNKYKVPLT